MPKTADQIWENASEVLREELDHDAYTTWLKPVRLARHDENGVVLSVPSIFYRNWLVNHYHDRIVQSLSAELGAEVRVLYEVQDDHADEVPGAPVERLSQAEQQRYVNIQRRVREERSSDLIQVPLNRNYSFDNFVVGESNRFAYAAAQAVADPESTVYNPLFIYGGVGLGKTHLMQAIGHQLQSFGRHFNVLYVSSEAFMNAFIDSVAQKRMSEFRNYFRNVDLLLVDDIQFFAGAEQTQTEFFHTFNALYDAGKKIVLSSDHPPKELNALEERLRSRFEWGLIVDVQPPNLETRVAILRQKAGLLGITMPPEATIYIAERIRSNLRELEGALTRLEANQKLTRRPITVDLVREVLGPLLVGAEPRKITIETVQMAVCRYFNISMLEITGGSRARKFSMPRQIASYLARELTDASFPELARQFGGRDHSSIIHSHKKVQKDMATDLSLQNLIKYLIKLIKEEPGGN